ncbi:MAG: carbohydrate binding family 9 domain-containing protein [bacterium]
MRRPLDTVVLVTLWLLSGVPAVVQAATYTVPMVSGEMTTDALLDEPFWQEALKLELTVEVQPGENIPALVSTEALVAFSETAFFVAIKAYDPRPEEIRARVCDRDDIWGDDWVALILDTFNDKRRYFDFFCNPFGVQADGTESVHGGGGMSWDAIWDSAGRITDEGYVVEFNIPFSSLRFQRSDQDQTWGIDIVRSYPRSVDHRLTLFPRDRNNNCYMCQSDELIGFAGVSPGKNIEIDPTLSAIYREERQDFPAGDFKPEKREMDPGVTARWGFTPNLTASATVYPDFSQVEADAAQLDINRQYALFFPETRPFFIEDQEFFSTGLDAVHTRTLADPVWGAKLTGKEGAHAIGFFTVRDEITNLIFPGPTNSSSTMVGSRSTGTVLRYRRDVGQASTLGLLFTDREGENGYYNRVGSLTGRVIITPKDRVRFQAMGSLTSYPDDVAAANGQPSGELKGNAYEFFYLHDTRSLDWYAIYRQTDSDLRADLGYMPQSGYRNLEIGWGHTWNNDPDNWWNMLNVGLAWEKWEQIDDSPLDEAWSCWFDYAGLSQSYLDLRGYADRSRYNGRDFDIAFLNFDVGVQPCSAFEFQLDGQVGDAIDYENTRQGNIVQLSPGMEMRLGRHLYLSVWHIYEHLDLPAGRLYTANVSQLRLVYQFTRRAFLRTILQRGDYHRNEGLYLDPVDTQSLGLFSQLLFSYTINPQTVLYLGYSDTHFGNQDIDLTQASRTFFAKVGYAWVP